jgi:hypothetical protein
MIKVLDITKKPDVPDSGRVREHCDDAERRSVVHGMA